MKMKIKICPICGSGDIGDKWVKGRKLVRYCRTCYWTDRHPRTPKKKEVETTKDIYVNSPCSFEIYDKYGYILMISKAYCKHDICKKELLKEIQIGKKDKMAGPYTGLIWPEKVKITAEVVK
jgi:hypothetical protein